MPQQAAESLPFAVSTFIVPLDWIVGQQMAAPVSQESPVEHCALPVQLVLQALGVPQMKGVQLVVPGAGQLPFPSQTLGFCCVRPVQLSLIVPQATVLSGYWQEPSFWSQPVMPHEGSVLPQATKQQLPVPVAPHWKERQASFSVQGPMAFCGMHVPPLQ